MAKMKTLFRRILRKEDKEDELHYRLRKAVLNGKAKQVAVLLDAGASPTWLSTKNHRHHNNNSDEYNALMLACQSGDVHMLNLLLDSFFLKPQLLEFWGPHMYSLVIRLGHWQAFLRLTQRNVPMHSISSTNSKLPRPIFIAAEYGRHQILTFLLRQMGSDWQNYQFNGHNLLSIASRNGHYECVEVLLASAIVTGEIIDFAVDCARQHRQAHVLVLLTSCLPEFCSDPEPIYKSNTSSGGGYLGGRDSDDFPMLLQSGRVQHRWSLAETEASDGDDDDQQERPGSFAWLRFSDEQQQPPLSTESTESMKRRTHPLQRTIDGFAVIQSARDAERTEQEESKEEEEEELGEVERGEGRKMWIPSPPTSTSSEDERWYAVKSNDQTDQSVELSLEILPVVHGAEVNNREKQTSPQKPAERPRIEYFIPPHPPVEAVAVAPPPQSLQLQQPRKPLPFPPISTPIVIAPVPSMSSHKVISIRSQSFRMNRKLPSIDEHSTEE